MYTPFEQLADERQRNKNFIPPYDYQRKNDII